MTAESEEASGVRTKEGERGERGMKTETTYTCEVCGSTFMSKADALACEARPKPFLHPRGTVFADHTKGSLYAELTFCVSRAYVDRHYAVHRGWITRDTHYGDTFDDKQCAFPDPHDGKIDKRKPCFKRMMAFLKEQGIKPIIFRESTQGG